MKFFIKTYGCTQNQADSIIMKQLLLKQGFIESEDEKNADYIIVNTCTVKTPTEHKILSYINKHKNKKIIISGCMVATNYDKLKKYPLIGCDNIFDIIKVIKNSTSSINNKKINKVNKTTISKNSIIEIIPISNGCLGNCSYCATKFARGKLHSYPKKEILIHIKNAIKNNKKEFWITAEDTGCYGLDNNDSIVNLLNEIINLEGFFKIRLGMMNPKYALKYKKELVKIMNNEKMFKFLHLPIQSASDNVLKLMRRPYEKKELEELFSYLKKNIKNLTLATDVIIGFPNETKKDFNETYNFIKKYKPQVLNISKYFNRPNTESSKMKNQITLEEKKKRTKKLMELHKKHNKNNIPIQTNILVDEKGIGRTDNYIRIKTNKKLGEYYLQKA